VKKITLVFLMAISTMLLPGFANACLSGDGVVSLAGFHNGFDGRMANERERDREWMKSFSHHQSQDNECNRWWHDRGRDDHWDNRHCPKSPAATPIPAAIWLMGSGMLGILCVGTIKRRRLV